MPLIRPIKKLTFTFPDNKQIVFEPGATYEVDEQVFNHWYTQEHLAPEDRQKVDLPPVQHVIGQPVKAIPVGQKPPADDASDQAKLDAEAKAKAEADKALADAEKAKVKK